MTHLYHKPVGGGAEIPQCSRAVCPPRRGAILRSSTGGADGPPIQSDQVCPWRKPVLGIRRRKFITLLGGAAAWPLAARAQQGDRVRRIGVLLADDENDPAVKPPRSAFVQALAGLGWIPGRNVRMDLRSTGADANRIRALAQELVGLQPDIILAGGSPAIVALQRETQTIPIVFVVGDDAVASSIVPRLDRPSGNVTGFSGLEATLGGKWLELLSEIAPGLKRTAIM